jgi:hypothetical protein
MSWLITGTQKTDPDALAYLSEVERADGQALESGTRDAVIAFVAGCKADGIWTAIKASCILAGARTLNGALVPLVGTAPTNFNFVSGDYNRKTGLVGNGSTKRLDSGRSHTTDPQNSRHVAAYSQTPPTIAIGVGTTDPTGTTQLNVQTSVQLVRMTKGVSDPATLTVSLSGPGFSGGARSSSSASTMRFGGVTYSNNHDSGSPISGNYVVFGRGTPSSPNTLSSARIAFYSIGESLDLALLDARVTTLINAFDAAI